VNMTPRAALNSDVLRGGAIAYVENSDFHIKVSTSLPRLPSGGVVSRVAAKQSPLLI
jgi:hypothetical protein